MRSCSHFGPSRFQQSRGGQAMMKLKQLAVISTPEPRMLVIQPFDASTVKNIENAVTSRCALPAISGVSP